MARATEYSLKLNGAKVINEKTWVMNTIAKRMNVFRDGALETLRSIKTLSPQAF